MKLILIFIVLITLNGCANSVAILGPASTTVGGGNITQSAFTSSVSIGIKKQTGRSPMEHVIAYAEKHNPEKKKSRCVSFLKSTESEICEAVKKNITQTQEYFKNKKKIIEISKIEDLARKSVIYNRR